MRHQFEVSAYGASVQVISRLVCQKWLGDSISEMSRFLAYWRKHVSALSQECGPCGRDFVSIEVLRDLLLSKLECSDALRLDVRSAVDSFPSSAAEQGYEYLLRIVDRHIQRETSRENMRAPAPDDPLRRPSIGPGNCNALLSTPTVGGDSGRPPSKRFCWHFQTKWNGGYCCSFSNCRFRHELVPTRAEFDLLPVPTAVIQQSQGADARAKSADSPHHRIRALPQRRRRGCFILKHFGCCPKGDACKFSHDANIVRKTALPVG